MDSGTDGQCDSGTDSQIIRNSRSALPAEGASQSALNIRNAHKVFATFAVFITFVTFTVQSVSNIHFYWGCFQLPSRTLADCESCPGKFSVSVSLGVCMQHTRHTAHSTQHATCRSLRVGVGIAKGLGTVAPMRGCIISACIYSRLRYRYKEKERGRGRERERVWWS